MPSQQQVEELEAQRAGAQRELLEAREALSRAALEAEVLRGEREALAEALGKVGAPSPTPRPPNNRHHPGNGGNPSTQPPNQWVPPPCTGWHP